MFAVIAGRDPLEVRRRALLFVLSTVAHCIAALGLAVVPLMFLGLLPKLELMTFLLAAPSPPLTQIVPNPPIVKSTAEAQGVTAEIAFTSPSILPKTIPAPGPEEDRVSADYGISGLPLPGSGAGITGGFLAAGSPWTSTDAAVPCATGAGAPLPAARRTPQLVGGNVLEGRIVKRVDPAYPRLAVQARISGSVVLQIGVDEEGNVEDIRVIQGHPLLVDAAVQAVRQWKYSPTLLNGEPVRVVGIVTVVFRLG